jgi:hypothetical protein
MDLVDWSGSAFDMRNANGVPEGMYFDESKEGIGK